MTYVTEIYQAYPRHVARIAAFKAIEKALIRLMDGEANEVPVSQSGAARYLLERTKAFAQSFAGQRGALTPHPATWFNRGGYMDDPTEWDQITPQEEKRLKMMNEANVGVWRPQ